MFTLMSDAGISVLCIFINFYLLPAEGHEHTGEEVAYFSDKIRTAQGNCRERIRALTREI